MFISDKVRDCIKPVIGWKNHYDLTEIPALTVALNTSESGEYFQEKYPALRLDYIQATLPSNRTLSNYLEEVEDAAITEMLNDVMTEKQTGKTAKETIANDVVINTEGYINDTIINEGKFVGIRFRVKSDIGLAVVINRIALQLTAAQSGIDIYVYHSGKKEPILQFNYATTVGGQFNWKDIQLQLNADEQDLSGGSFYVGYYQDDLTGNAVKFKKLNWNSGYCGTCDGGIMARKYSTLQKYVDMQPFYLPAASIIPGRDMFNPEDIFEVMDNNFGFNFNVTVKCDMTTFFCDNRLSLKNLYGMKVTIKILKDILYSQQINYIEEALKEEIRRELEGDSATRQMGLTQQYMRAIKALKFDYSEINKSCLPCSTNTGVSYANA